ncbi:reverse transcriptase Ty1/copia-type domain-containing protein [Haematococcus lacustris]|uniref:Reverse transcriptase Ty1/copia-type domain-containing protein n=1 Tax=Haematococcus lacustris TaxID=44745 RepID=A0A699Z9Z3_HAELA|nr:reverse transcriptase Ty1/copia-type domain-containing protein [Haematococcus lacustris]
MPLRHWADAAKLSNYVRCVLPVSDQPLTPWESFLGVRPDLSGLRVFGSAVWVHVPDQKRSKLEAKAVRGVLIGYQLGAKSYRVLVEGREYLSKDVIFDEQLVNDLPTRPTTQQLHFPGVPAYPALPAHAGLLVPVAPPGGDTRTVGAPQTVPAAMTVISMTAEPQSDRTFSAAVGAPAVSPQNRPASRPALAPLLKAQDAPLPAAIVAPGAPIPRRNPHRDRRPPAQIRQPELHAMTVTDSQANDNPTVAEALSGPQADMWLQAMHAELASLHENQTWCLVDKRAGARGAIEKFKARLVAKGYMQVSVFGIKNLGDTKWFLGMKVTRDRALGTLKLDQQQYVHELLKTYGMTAAHSKSVPMAPAVKLEKEGVALDTSEHSYSGLVGSLLYLSCCTRPDITYAVGALARYMSSPTQQHWTAARAILSYLKGTADQGLVFGEAAELQGYCDADYAGDKDTARSTTGYVFAMNGAAISWSSRLQPTVAMSTAEAEYMAASSAVKEGLWLRKLMQDLQLPGDCTSIMCDNQAALQLLHNPIASARAKHINVHHHFARERVARGEVSFSYCSTASMVADIMTKPLSLVKFSQGKQGCGVSN